MYAVCILTFTSRRTPVFLSDVLTFNDRRKRSDRAGIWLVIHFFYLEHKCLARFLPLIRVCPFLVRRKISRSQLPLRRRIHAAPLVTQIHHLWWRTLAIVRIRYHEVRRAKWEVWTRVDGPVSRIGCGMQAVPGTRLFVCICRKPLSTWPSKT